MTIQASADEVRQMSRRVRPCGRPPGEASFPRHPSLNFGSLAESIHRNWNIGWGLREVQPSGRVLHRRRRWAVGLRPRRQTERGVSNRSNRWRPASHANLAAKAHLGPEHHKGIDRWAVRSPRGSIGGRRALPSHHDPASSSAGKKVLISGTSPFAALASRAFESIEPRRPDLP